MRPVRILATATAIEGCLLTAVFALLGAGGAWSNALDLINCAAPLLLALAAGCAWATHVLLARSLFRTLCIAAGLVSVVFNLGLLAPEIVGAIAQPRTAAPRPYRLVTANVFHGNERSYHAAWDIVGRGADAVLLQESDGTLSGAQWIFAASYPYSSHCPDTDVRIWTKRPILDEGCGLSVAPDSPTAWIRGLIWVRTLDTNGRPITLATLHLPHPFPTHSQAVQLEAMAGALAKVPQEDLVLTGDFNTAPWTFAMHKQDRLLRPLRRRTFFWWSWPARINLVSKAWSLPFLPVDHIYAGPRWGRVRLTRFRVTASDHFATEAVLSPAQ